MTEVASLLLPADHRLTSVRHYQAGPPEGLELVEPGETFATTKEEEWVSKKKTEVTNTKQIETRVKRQVVLEDGKVVEDSGPMVTTNTTEDSETQEHHQTELRKLGDDGTDGAKNALEGPTSQELADPNSKWVATTNPDGIVREVKEKRVISREETEELKEMEDVHHYGNITDEDFLAAVNTGKQDLRKVLRTTSDGRAVVSTGPRLVHESTKSNKVTDTEDTRELSSVLPDGKIVTETQRTTEHEEVRDDELPADAPDQDHHKESSQRYFKSRDQEDVDYVADGVKVGHEMRFKTETMEVERHGDGVDEPDFDSLSARARRRTNNRQPHRYRGISQWSERRQENHYSTERPSPKLYHLQERSRSPELERLQQRSPVPDYARDITPDYGPVREIIRVSPKREVVSPTPPQRKRTTERRQQIIHQEERSRYTNGVGYRSNSGMSNGGRPRDEPLEEPPPDYSPPNPPPMPSEQKKVAQKTRFAPDPPKAKSGNIIGQSIRKLVGKIRSASAERKARQRAKRSPSPSYQKGHVIDGNIGSNGHSNNGHSNGHSNGHHHGGMENGGRQPVQRYYLGEDPFAGSIYGRENKYDGVKPARSSRKQRDVVEELNNRSAQSTLGRFSKSTGRLANGSVSEQRNSQTLPRHLSRHNHYSHEPPTRLEKGNRSNSTINVSIINTVSRPPPVQQQQQPQGPAKPARTYKSSLSRSKSLNVHADDPGYRRPDMYTSNPHLHRLDENPAGLKSPGLISSLSRSQKDLHEESYTGRFARNGFGDASSAPSDNKRVFLKSLKDHSPELFKTLHEDDHSTTTWKSTSPTAYSTPIKNHRNYNNGDIYEPPTRLRDTHVISTAASPHPQSILRRGSSSSTDYSETYHTTTRNLDDPRRPSVTNTVKTVSKKTIPSKDGRTLETIESSETKSVTKSHFRGGSNDMNSRKFYESERRYGAASPVVIEVRNNYRK